MNSSAIFSVFRPAPPSVSLPPVPHPGFVFMPGSPAVPRVNVRPPPPLPVRPVRPVIDDEEPIVTPELEQAVSQITELGFSDIDKIVKVLKENNGDCAVAIDKLLEDAAY